MSIWLRTSASSLRSNSSRCFVGHPRRCGSNTALSISQDRAPCGSSTLICGNPQVLGRNAEGCGSGNRLALQRTAWLSHPRSQRTSEGCRLSTSGRCMEPQFFPSTSEAPRSPRWGFFFSGGAIGHDRAPVQWTRDEVCGADHQRGTSTPSLTGAPEANSARSRAAVDRALRGDHRGAQGALRIGEAVSLRWADVDAAVCAFDSRAQRRSVTVRVGCTSRSGSWMPSRRRVHSRIAFPSGRCSRESPRTALAQRWLGRAGSPRCRTTTRTTFVIAGRRSGISRACLPATLPNGWGTRLFCCGGVPPV